MRMFLSGMSFVGNHGEDNMNWVITYLDFLARPKKISIQKYDLLLRISSFSSRPELALKEANELFKHFPKMEGKDQVSKVIIDVDLLYSENEWSVKMGELSELVNAWVSGDDVSLSIRTKDFGATEFINKKLSHIPCQVNLEIGHHNWESIESWIDRLGNRIERIIFSYELPASLIHTYCEKIDDLSRKRNSKFIERELLVAGPILLFTSPRKLLSVQLEDEELKEKQIELMGNDQYSLYAIVDSQESPHHGFTSMENASGTLLFHPKFLNLFDQNLSELGLTHGRVEFCLTGESNLSIEQKNSRELFFKKGTLKESEYSFPSLRGFFHTNKSKVIFKKLKNQNLVARSKEYAGHILDTVKGEFLIMQVEHELGLQRGEELLLRNPEGEETIIKLMELKNTSFEDQKSIGQGELALIPYVKKMVSQTLVEKWEKEKE
ncbi:MAG: U32 family peptidase [Bacteriovoracaceae bacterium]|nr:U32 family peptidase [Bacteriovoracaceae bacterium]